MVIRDRSYIAHGISNIMKNCILLSIDMGFCNNQPNFHTRSVPILLLRLIATFMHYIPMHNVFARLTRLLFQRIFAESVKPQLRQWSPWRASSRSYGDLSKNFHKPSSLSGPVVNVTWTHYYSK